MGEHLQLNAPVLDRARVSRDPRFDGKFFIAVTSTGVYCRPICPSRTSKPENVRYYETAAAAAEAGFRPCLRCRPEAAPGTPAWLGTSAVVNRAMRLINEGALDEASVATLAGRLGVSARHLHRLFMRHVGASPITVAQTRRLHFAKRLLDETRLPITEIALASGYGSVRRFNDAFRQTYERPPSALRAMRGAGGAATAGEVTLKLAYRPPYDWLHMASFLAAHTIPGVERVDDAGYTRAIATAAGHALVSVRPMQIENALELRVSGAEPAMLVNIATAARRMFDLGADSRVIDEALAADPLLRSSVTRRPGLRIPGAWDPFECAAHALVAEHGRSGHARRLLTRLVACAGANIEGGVEGLTHTFPTPAMLASADLDRVGLPQTAVRALRALAEKLAALASASLDSEAVVQTLASAGAHSPGVMQIIELRSLSNPDAWPIEARSLALADSELISPLAPSQWPAHAEGWRPWRSYAAMHVWASTRKSA